MANYVPIAPVDYVTGKLNKKDKTVFRQKFARETLTRITLVLVIYRSLCR